MRLEYFITDKEKEELKRGVKQIISANEREVIREIVEADFAECLTHQINEPLGRFRGKAIQHMKTVDKFQKRYEHYVEQKNYVQIADTINEFIFTYYEDIEKKIKNLRINYMYNGFKSLCGKYGINQYDEITIDFYKLIHMDDVEIDKYIEDVFCKKTELMEILQRILKFNKELNNDEAVYEFLCSIRNLYNPEILTYTHNEITCKLKQLRKRNR
jgi:hypothetical protein